MTNRLKRAWLLALTLAMAIGSTATMASAQKAYLEITLKVDAGDRPAAAAIYTQYKAQFLQSIPGAVSKQLLVRDDDVQVLHGFSSASDAQTYLKSTLFNKDVVTALKPLLKASPDIRIYTAD